MGKDLKGKELPTGIMQRPNGVYRGRFKYNGEQYILHNKNLKELIQEMDDLRYEVKHGIKGKCSDVSLDSWFDVWLNIAYHRYYEIQQNG